MNELSCRPLDMQIISGSESTLEHDIEIIDERSTHEIIDDGGGGRVDVGMSNGQAKKQDEQALHLLNVINIYIRWLRILNI